MKKFYIAENDGPKGPYSIDELRNLKIPATILVWEEGTPNWIEAKDVLDLKNITISTPPPLPSKERDNKLEKEKTFNINLGIKKKPDTINKKIIKQKRKTIVAKEIKIAGKILLISFFIGILSYPILSYKGYKALFLKKKYEEFSSHSSEFFEVEEKIEKLIPKGHKRDFYNGYEFSYDYVLDYYSQMTYLGISWAIVVLLMSFILIFIGRYIYKGINWVSENTKN